jgi:hypothetical protein
MATATDLDNRIATLLTGAGYTVAPSGEDPFDIPGHGVGKWIAVDLQPDDLSGPDGTNVSISRYTLTLGALVAITTSRRTSKLGAQTIGTTLRNLLDTNAALATVDAHALPESVEIEVSPDRSAYAVRVNFNVLQTTTSA